MSPEPSNICDIHRRLSRCLQAPSRTACPGPRRTIIFDRAATNRIPQLPRPSAAMDLRSSRVDGMVRNRWTASIGTGGRHVGIGGRHRWNTQLVCVRMESGQRVPGSLWNPVWIHGTLTVEKTTNLYGSVCPARWLAHRYRPTSGDQSLRYRRNVKSWLRRVDGGCPATSAHGNPSRPNGMKRRSCSPD